MLIVEVIEPWTKYLEIFWEPLRLVKLHIIRKFYNILKHHLVVFFEPRNDEKILIDKKTSKFYPAALLWEPPYDWKIIQKSPKNEREFL